MDENLEPATFGEIGEICILGGGVSRGYIGDRKTENTAFTRLPDGRRIYRSGDLGYFLPDGNVAFLRRKDRQIMNACYGGTLYQDLPTERPGGIDHHMAPPYDRIAHRVDILAGTPLFDVLGKKRIGVNSYHHQAIRRLSEKFRPMAYSEDGLVEAIYMRPGTF